MTDECDSLQTTNTQHTQLIPDLKMKEGSKYVIYKCKYEGKYRICRLLDQRKNEETRENEYYVQFIELNDRYSDYYKQS